MARHKDTRVDELRRWSNPLYNDRKLKLGTFSTNLSGGCAMSTIDGVMKADWASTAELARMADEMEFEALVPVGRWKGYGGITNFNDAGFECYTWAAGISALTRYPSVFATSHISTMHPMLAAKQGMTIDHIANGRFSLNIVASWFTPEIQMFGEPLIDHEARYARADEWVEIVKRLWTSEDDVDFDGRFYNVKKASLHPKPIQQPHPVIMNAGGSERGRIFAAKHCDVVFVNVAQNDLALSKKIVADYRAFARAEFGRELQVWSYAYVVQGDTEDEARAFFNHYVHEKGDWEAADNLVKLILVESKALPPEVAEQMKTNFIAGWGGYPLIGTKEQIVDGLQTLSDIGLDGTLLSWPRYIDGMREFQEVTLPLVREAGLR